MELADLDAAKAKLSAYLQSKDNDLNQEQADILAGAAIKFAQEAGRVLTHKFSKKGFDWAKEKVSAPSGKSPKEMEKPKVDAPKTESTLKPLGLGSTGRSEPKNLVEQMAMKGAMENPQLGKVISKMKPISDPRWLGWTKMRYKVETGNGGKVVIHYVGKWEDGILKAIGDFKFK